MLFNNSNNRSSFSVTALQKRADKVIKLQCRCCFKFNVFLSLQKSAKLLSRTFYEPHKSSSHFLLDQVKVMVVKQSYVKPDQK